MTWLTGTATNFEDLFVKVKDHLVTAGWTIRNFTTSAPAPNTHEMFCQGPGAGAGYEVFFGMRTFENAAQNHFCFETQGYTDYVTGANWFTHPGISASTVITRLWDDTIPYWLAVNDRRIILIAKCSGTYHSLYAGFFTPFANPVEYPYPFYLASDASYIDAFGEAGVNVRSIAAPGLGAALVRTPGGNWRQVAVNVNGDTSYRTLDNVSYTCWPYHSPSAQSSILLSNFTPYPPNVRMRDIPGLGDSLFIVPVHLFGCGDTMGVIGTLDGVFWFTGIGSSAEQLLTNGGDNYRVFIAINRAVENPPSTYAIKEA